MDWNEDLPKTCHVLSLESGSYFLRLFRCELVRSEEERKFASFGAVWFMLACVSSFYVVARQREIDEKILIKINKQIAAGV
jgi:hypothetical protein